jgi:hypothetical protein
VGGGAGDPAGGQPLDGPEGGLNRNAFEILVRRLADEIPPDYLDGVAAIDVSPRTVPHPARPEVFTLGECIPLHGEGDEITSRVVLYHGSFRALAQQVPDFDWRAEAWETLTHELRHHLEWRAHADQLEAYDWAAEQNFARHAGEPFDPLFFLSGERMGDALWQVDDDVFLDRPTRAVPATATFTWRGRGWRVAVPAGTLPLFLAVDGLPVPPTGDLILVFRRPPGLLEVFRRPAPPRGAMAVARRTEAR